MSADPAAPYARRRALSPKSHTEPARPHSAAALGGGDNREHRRGSHAVHTVSKDTPRSRKQIGVSCGIVAARVLTSAMLDFDEFTRHPVHETVNSSVLKRHGRRARCGTWASCRDHARRRLRRRRMRRRVRARGAPRRRRRQDEEEGEVHQDVSGGGEDTGAVDYAEVEVDVDRDYHAGDY